MEADKSEFIQSASYRTQPRSALAYIEISAWYFAAAFIQVSVFISAYSLFVKSYTENHVRCFYVSACVSGQSPVRLWPF